MVGSLRRCRRPLDVSPDAGVAARLAPETARQLVDVLLDNALRHGAAATAVTVEASGRWACLQVTDEGPGIPRRRAERLFSRGVSSRNGGGVGLAVARELVRREGGDLRLVATQPATFEAVVPAA